MKARDDFENLDLTLIFVTYELYAREYVLYVSIHLDQMKTFLCDIFAQISFR